MEIQRESKRLVARVLGDPPKKRSVGFERERQREEEGEVSRSDANDELRDDDDDDASPVAAMVVQRQSRAHTRRRRARRNEYSPRRREPLGYIHRREL